MPCCLSCLRRGCFSLTIRQESLLLFLREFPLPRKNAALIDFIVNLLVNLSEFFKVCIIHVFSKCSLTDNNNQKELCVKSSVRSPLPRSAVHIDDLEVYVGTHHVLFLDESRKPQKAAG